jgi:hypothetical protein
MNTELLFLFLILLLGLVLCSFLGGNCGKEGLENNTTIYIGPNGATARISTNSNGTSIITLTQYNDSEIIIFTQSSSNSNSYTSPAGYTATISNGNITITSPNGSSQTFTPSTSSSSSSSSSTSTSTSPSTSSSTTTSPSTTTTTSSSPSSTYYDNYNHYNGSGSSYQLQNGMIFTGSNGDTIVVITNSNGTQSLKFTSISKSTTIILNPTPSYNSNVTTQSNTYYSPYGDVTATITTDSNGQTAIKVNYENKTILFIQSGSSSVSTTSTQYYGSTGTPIQQSSYSLAYGGTAGSVTGPNGNTVYYAQGPNGNTVAGTTNNGYPNYNTNQYYGPYGGTAGSVTGPNGNTVYYAQGPYGNTVAGTTNNGYPNYNTNQYYGPYGGTVGSVTGPNGNTAYYAQGPYGNTVAGTTNNEYYNSLPPGIPASQIPPGQEDLYILKTEVVPPVCPACPQSSACPRQEPCPPCPACARCPEPAFECKKVPNYSAMSDEYLPAPVLNDFSQFGM